MMRRYLLPVVLTTLLFLLLSLPLSPPPSEAPPALSPPGGGYARTVWLTMRPARAGVPIVFTSDGSPPSADLGLPYTRPLRLDARFPALVVIRARQFPNGRGGDIATASYAVGVSHALPILSLVADPADLWNPDDGILTHPWTRREITAHLTLIEGDGPASLSLSAGLRVEEAEPRPTLRLAFRREYGTPALVYTLFPEHPADDPVYKRLLLSAAGGEERPTLLEEALPAAVAADLGVPVARRRFVLLFLNGEPWGIYELRERVDRFFLRDRLGLGGADLVWNGRALEGDVAAWRALTARLANYDPQNSAHREALRRRVDFDTLVDAALLQAFFERPGVMAARSRKADGRWLWLYPPPPPPDAPRPDTPLHLLAPLLADEVYRARYLARAADVLNTTLSASALEARLAQMAAPLRADIGYELTRYPLLAPPDVRLTDPLEAWARHLDRLRYALRRRPDELRRQLVAAFDLQGTATLTFTAAPPQGGTILVNDSPLPALPFRGTYFLGTEVRLVAVPALGYRFAGWERRAGEASAVVSLTVTGPQEVVAHFAPGGVAVRPNDVMINEYWIDDDGTRYASLGGRGIVGDWVELRVARPEGVDLRGWRLTDNDTKSATDEGSLIFPPLDVFAHVPKDTVILIIATACVTNAVTFPVDDLDATDGRLVLYVGNGHLDVTTDPGFDIGRGDEALALLAPGVSASLADDVGVDFVAEGEAVTPASFGLLADGVRFVAPFRGLGRDDGVVFTGRGSNDDGRVGWIVDPPPEQSGDVLRLGAVNVLTPGAPNEGQPGPAIPLWPYLLAGLAVVVGAWLLRRVA